MNRRRFVLISMSASVAAGIPLSYCGKGSQTVQPDFLVTLIGKAGTKKLGEVYLEQFPAEADIKKLTDLISADVYQPETDVKISIENQFRNANIIIINGWILSVIEARQSALLFLNS